MGRKETVIGLILSTAILFTSSSQSFDSRVDLHGGQTTSKTMALWELERYKYTELLRREPLCWCPYKSYLLVDKYVEVRNENNKNVLSINADLIELTRDDAEYNKSHAPTYKGTTMQKVRKIYRYCRRTRYKAHVKYARDVFEDRTGDCAAIASAFYVLCRKNHIPVRYCIGWCEGDCHAFNRVKVGKKWYYIDAALGRWLWKPLYDGYTVMEMW